MRLGFTIFILLGISVSLFAEVLGTRCLLPGPKKNLLYIAQEEAERIDCFDLADETILESMPVTGKPTGMLFSAENNELIVTLGDRRRVAVLDRESKTVKTEIVVGAGPCSPVLDAKRHIVYVCNRFDGSISAIDLRQKEEMARIPVTREPIAADISQDGHWLFVANHLPEEPSTAEHVAANVSVIDTQSMRVEKEIELPNGSSGARDLIVSPDGRHVYVSHILARYTVHTTQLEQGWMNTNAVSILDAQERERIATVLLDDVDHGAANPWALAVSEDGNTLIATHAGTHEASVIDVRGLMKTLQDAEDTSREPMNILSFLHGCRERIPLAGEGPRSVAIVEDRVYVGEYFSDSLAMFDLYEKPPIVRSVALNPNAKMSKARWGQRLFNDARLCFQNWQSCASCHPDGRADGLNWDLMNDSIGNPKNAKSLLLAHKTPPVMSTGVRETAEHAVRAGMQYIQFTQRMEKQAEAIDAYLRAIQPVPSPYLMNGKLSQAAQRGKALFYQEDVGCFRCHPKPYYTDMKRHDVGTHGPTDFTLNEDGERVPQTKFDTPTLIEAWRTGPYMHDGRYATIEEVITVGNHGDRRGKTSHLTKEQIHDLIEFILSL
ncbi:beta-propeller fold lactonase family protein [bacterium]|nr:beta-propeller fold lactonase family protein [bacterium]